MSSPSYASSSSPPDELESLPDSSSVQSCSVEPFVSFFCASMLLPIDLANVLQYVGTTHVHMLSMPMAFTPRLMRGPRSPQYSPHELRTCQNFSPSSVSAPADDLEHVAELAVPRHADDALLVHLGRDE